ncbi:hypothetical protein C8F01DRAFT_1110322 [Mycena amicta]|nr:hypothetical protein C8F01DRAFT_1110322 [Mycena amicta]
MLPHRSRARFDYWYTRGSPAVYTFLTNPSEPCGNSPSLHPLISPTMFANGNASRSFTSLTIEEIGWLSASKAFGDDGDSVHGVFPTEPQSVAIPKNLRYADTRRRSILLDDFLGTSKNLSRSSKTRFGFTPPSSRPETPPPSPDEVVLGTPPRTGFYSATPSIQEEEMPPSPPRPTEWLYRRPRSPSTLSRSPSSLSSSRSVTPTPSRLRGGRPHTPAAVAEMNMSPFYSTVVPPVKRSPSIRTGSPALRRPSTPSRSSPNLLEFRGSPRAKTLPHPTSAAAHSQRASTSSFPRTPPSPSLYSQHSFAPPLPETRATTPTRSILTQSPKRSPSTSTKHSGTSKSVKFDELAPRYSGDHKATIGDGKVRGEEWNSRLVEGVDCIGMGDENDLDAPVPAKPHGALKRFLTLRTRKNKPRPEISGPFALSPTTGSPTGTISPAAHRPLDAETQSLFGVGSTPASPFRYRAPAASTSSFLQNDASSLASKPKKAYTSSLLSSDELGVVPERFHTPIANKFYSSPARFKAPPPSASKASSIADFGSTTFGTGTSETRPVLHALPSMESFRSVKSTRSCNRFRGWLGRIGIGVAA